MFKEEEFLGLKLMLQKKYQHKLRKCLKVVSLEVDKKIILNHQHLGNLLLLAKRVLEIINSLILIKRYSQDLNIHWNKMRLNLLMIINNLEVVFLETHQGLSELKQLLLLSLHNQLRILKHKQNLVFLINLVRRQVNKNLLVGLNQKVQLKVQKKPNKRTSQDFLLKILTACLL